MITNIHQCSQRKVKEGEFPFYEVGINMICYPDTSTYKNENYKSITLINLVEIRILANKTQKYIKMATNHDFLGMND